ncbi:hypothetical protein K443DRAFT_216954 [Laccaria amethystina LaAM-08-1]|uniref:Uncharacterized protein n=1 Tax=Laccaria amethystina LaAM-08-1 TaxID=1095629 RepID=A0A0C9XZM2_9AGAR|nr:hypothetical protein K443DRAFT_216954 [Laccaria amethystina LaAM-08-1]
MLNARRLSCNPPFRRQQALADKLTKRRISDAGLRLDKDLDLAGPRQTGKTPTELCSYSIVWWSLLGLTKLVNFQGRWVSEVSRRMENLRSTLHPLGRSVQHFLPPRLPSGARHFVFSRPEAKEGEEKVVRVNINVLS